MAARERERHERSEEAVFACNSTSNSIQRAFGEASVYVAEAEMLVAQLE